MATPAQYRELLEQLCAEATDPAAADALTARGHQHIDFSPRPEGIPGDRQGLRQALIALHGAVSDLDVRVLAAVVEGDAIAGHLVVTGTEHCAADTLGLGGAVFSCPALVLLQVRDGLVVEARLALEGQGLPRSARRLAATEHHGA